MHIKFLDTWDTVSLEHLTNRVLMTLACSAEPGNILTIFAWEQINFHVDFMGLILWKIYTQLYLNFLTTIKKLAKLSDLSTKPGTLSVKMVPSAVCFSPNTFSSLKLESLSSVTSALIFLKWTIRSSTSSTFEG